MEELRERESLGIAVEKAHQVHDYLLIQNLSRLNQLWKNTASNRPDLLYAVVSDRQGRIVTRTFGASPPPAPFSPFFPQGGF